jgi:hypothetical protein
MLCGESSVASLSILSARARNLRIPRCWCRPRRLVGRERGLKNGSSSRCDADLVRLILLLEDG